MQHNSRYIYLFGSMQPFKPTRPYKTLAITLVFYNAEILTNFYIHVTQDVSGKDKARPLWNRYFSDTIALIWVVDSSDHRRLQLSKQELHRVARDPELSKAAVLVYINKQDLRDGEEGLCIANCTVSECAQMQRKTFGAQK
jgi:GTPase SAR1 family protein